MEFRAALLLCATALAAACHRAHESEVPPWWLEGTWVEVGDEALLGWKEPDRVVVGRDRVLAVRHHLDSEEVSAREWPIVGVRWAHDESWIVVRCGTAGDRRAFEFQREEGGHFASIFESMPKGYDDGKGDEAWGSFGWGRFMSAGSGTEAK